MFGIRNSVLCRIGFKRLIYIVVKNGTVHELNFNYTLVALIHFNIMLWSCFVPFKDVGCFSFVTEIAINFALAIEMIFIETICRK